MEEFVRNDVYTFLVSINLNKEVSVYTREGAFLGKYEDDEEEVQERYFTKERIEELKREFVKKIQETENPFEIYCVDVDGDYNVTEDQIFNG